MPSRSTIAITCSNAECGQKFQVPRGLIGKTIACKKCGSRIAVTAISPRSQGAQASRAPTRTRKQPVSNSAPRHEIISEALEAAQSSDEQEPKAQPLKRRKTGRKRKKRSLSDFRQFYRVVGGFVLFAVFAVLTVLVALLSPSPAKSLMTFLFITGQIMAIVGGMWCLIIAFREATGIGILYLIDVTCLFRLYFLLTRLKRTWYPFLLQLVGFSILIIPFTIFWMRFGFTSPFEGILPVQSPYGAPAQGNFVFVVTGVSDEVSHERVSSRLGDLLFDYYIEQNYRSNSPIRTSGRNQRLYKSVEGVPSPELFARRIDFGTVTEVSEYSMEIELDPNRLPPEPAAGLEPFDLALWQIRSGQRRYFSPGVEYFRVNNPVEPNDEVAVALGKLLEVWYGVGINDLLEALDNWGTTASIPYLCKALESPYLLDEDSINHQLGNFDDPAAAAALASQLPSASSFDLEDLYLELRRMSSKVEHILIPYLEHEQPKVRRTICRLMGDLGTDACVESLQKRLEDDDRKVVKAAQTALDTIANR